MNVSMVYLVPTIQLFAWISSKIFNGIHPAWSPKYYQIPPFSSWQPLIGLANTFWGRLAAFLSNNVPYQANFTQISSKKLQYLQVGKYGSQCLPLEWDCVTSSLFTAWSFSPLVNGLLGLELHLSRLVPSMQLEWKRVICQALVSSPQGALQALSSHWTQKAWGRV